MALTQFLIGAQILSLPFLIDGCSDNRGNKNQHKTQETLNYNTNNSNNSNSFNSSKKTEKDFPNLNSKNIDTIRFNFDYNPREDPYEKYNKQLDIEVISEEETDLKISDKIIHVPEGKSTVSFPNIDINNGEIIPVGDVRISPVELDVQYPEVMKMRNDCVVIEATNTLNIYSSNKSFFGNIFFESLDEQLVSSMNEDMNKFIFSDDIGKEYAFDIEKEKFNSKARFSNLKLEKIIFNDNDTLFLDSPLNIPFDKEERQIIRLNVPEKNAKFTLKFDEGDPRNIRIVKMDLVRILSDGSAIDLDELDNYIFSKKFSPFFFEFTKIEESIEVSPGIYYVEWNAYSFYKDERCDKEEKFDVHYHNNKIMRLYPGLNKIINFNSGSGFTFKSDVYTRYTFDEAYDGRLTKTFKEKAKEKFGQKKFQGIYSTGWQGEKIVAGDSFEKKIDYDENLIEVYFNFPAYQNKFEKMIQFGRYDDFIGPFLSQKALEIIFKENGKEYKKEYYYNEFNNSFNSFKGEFYFESRSKYDERKKEKDTIFGENFAIGYKININIKDLKNDGSNLVHHSYDIRNTDATVIYDLYKISKPKIKSILKNGYYSGTYLFSEDGDSTFIF